jgi:hypothetical protein
MIETEKGFEKLPQDLKSSKTMKQSIIKWVKSSVTEGYEEMIKDLSTAAWQKTIFNNESDWISLDENKKAVFNLPNMIENGLYGAIMGGITGVPSLVDSILRLPNDSLEIIESTKKTIKELVAHLQKGGIIN